MKRLLLFLTFVCLTTAVKAQRITFSFQDGIYNTILKNKMESTISDLLTEFNTAYRNGRRLQLDRFALSDKARRSLTFTWDSIASFTCDDDRNISKCLTCVTGYEVREIYITLHPRKPSEFTGNVNREFSIGFTKDGTISFARPISDDNTYKAVFQQGSDVTDMRRRHEILNFVEDFRRYYDEKNIDALEQIYSDDALIITGSVMKKGSLGDQQGRLRPEVKYNKMSKKEYINKLRGIFARNKYIKVKFEDIEVMSHPARDGFYGVALKQNWKAMNAAGGTRYEDDGYLFLLWEFPDDPNGQPLIHVRTWQPDKYDTGEPLLEEDKIDLNNFFIPEKKNR